MRFLVLTSGSEPLAWTVQSPLVDSQRRQVYSVSSIVQDGRSANQRCSLDDAGPPRQWGMTSSRRKPSGAPLKLQFLLHWSYEPWDKSELWASISSPESMNCTCCDFQIPNHMPKRLLHQQQGIKDYFDLWRQNRCSERLNTHSINTFKVLKEKKLSAKSTLSVKTVLQKRVRGRS